ncbi:MAG TPA: signal peptidase II [Candidatus Limnocylindrales bacterium]|nr:signal peptidase II [Candidatus Limnocylindrales bacterium]
MKSRVGTFLACAAVVLALDQVTKVLASSRLIAGDPVPVLGQVVRLTLVHNTGAAFGLFPGSRLPFILISVLAIVVVLYLFARDAYRSFMNRVLLGCILGGALGNLVDRVRWGRVVDFIDVGFGALRWPVFNVADSAVTLGVILLAWNLARSGRTDSDLESPSGSDFARG